MLDIVFISYDEPNAEHNWKKLKERFPFAKRVHGVDGIAKAHSLAAKKANTEFFYTVDGDTEISDDFGFTFRPDIYESDYVHIWYALNPATGKKYGYGGVKLFRKKFFKNIKSQLDFSTTLTQNVKYHSDVASTTHFNSDPYRAFRGAFRESAKLRLSITLHSAKTTKEQSDAISRLSSWENPEYNCAYRDYIIAGCQEGKKIADHNSENIMLINDMSYIDNLFKSLYPNIDLNLDPSPKDSNPMKHELFFITRISSALYNPVVLSSIHLTELRDALSDGQMLSKLWLVEEFIKNIPQSDKKLKVVITGGWIGTLSLLMNTWELPVEITSIDLDRRANHIAEVLNYDFEFKTITEDMFKVSYDEYDIIINTSSEHIDDITSWCNSLPKGKIVIVQNNNYLEGEGHVSTVINSQELVRTLNLSEILYEGTKQFKQYDRYMVIGRT